MNIDEFMERVASEPDRAVTLTVWTTPSEVLATASRPAGLSMMDLFAAKGLQPERREVQYGHVLGLPASEHTLAAREHQWRPLPADLRALMTSINGIHLWADKGTGRSYTGLAAIEEWDLARIKIHGSAPLLDDRYVAISYHEDGAAFVVLNLESGQYFLMDAAGPDTTALIASNANDLLDWFWNNRIAPKNGPT